MDLTKEDKKLLLNWGYSEADFEQITKAAHISNTRYKLGNTPIGRELAIRLLGRKEYLSGLARSAFHRTATRRTESGDVVLFDSSRLLR